MATLPLNADTASFSYSNPVSPFGTVSITLAIPLWDIQPMDVRERHDWWATDNSNREIVTVGEADVYDILATIRFDNEPTELKTMLRLALQYDLTLTYSQNSVNYPVRLVAIVGAVSPSTTPLSPDRDRHGYGEWEVRVHLRRTDGSNLNSLFGGS